MIDFWKKKMVKSLSSKYTYCQSMVKLIMYKNWAQNFPFLKNVTLRIIETTSCSKNIINLTFKNYSCK